jgi:flagellar motor switch protein FliN/FliY
MAEASPEVTPENVEACEAGAEGAAAAPERPIEPPGATLDDLPKYTHSLLRIKLPVIVTLARTRQPVGRILELAPGSIIQFEKSCEELLELDVGERSIATGQAVKVGDKFGLQVNSMILPGERFASVRKGREPQRDD